MKTTTIGWIGLGAMGEPMARRLLQGGRLHGVYNRSDAPTRPFREEGVHVYPAPRPLATACDVVVVMVRDDAALEAVLFEDEGVVSGLRPGDIVVNMSTVSAAATAEAAVGVAAAGGHFVDAPVSGTVGPARQGTLVVLASGEDEVLEAIAPVLETFGSVRRLGPAGQGTRAKLFINLLLGASMQALAEALVFGTRQGLDLATMLDIIDGGALAAPMFRLKGESIGARAFEKQFSVDLLLKDLDLALDEAREGGVYLPQAAATREAVSGVRALGHGEQDIAALVRLLESVSGITVRS